MENPVVPFEQNLCGHLLAGLLWERQFEKVLLKHGWEKIPNWECLFVHREKGFLSVYVDDIKLAGKKHNIDPMWKLLNKEVDLGAPTSFLDHVFLGCTQRQCEISNNTVKCTSSDTENHDKNCYVKLYDDKNIFMTNEDNDNSDTTYTNKNDTNNHNAHNLHKRAQQRAVSVCLHYVSHHIGSSRP